MGGETTPEAKPEPDERKPGLWKKLEILGRPISASLMTAAVAIFGWWGQKSISEITQIEQNARLYTELISRRETSESELRKDMFNTILGDFFANPNQKSGDPPEACAKTLDQRLLKFELLALNFGESLSISPIFRALQRSIDSGCDYTTLGETAGLQERDKHAKRLRSLARRIADRQVSTLMTKGNLWQTTVQESDFVAQGKSLESVYRPQGSTPAAQLDTAASDATPQPFTEYCMSLQYSGIARLVRLEFRSLNKTRNTIKITPWISSIVWKGPADEVPKQLCDVYAEAALAGEPGHLGFEESLTPKPFTLDYFNFPLIDNTVLSHDQRLAVILDTIDKIEPDTNEPVKSAAFTVRVLLFPGQYASRRDTPVLTDALKSLQLSTRNAGDD